MRKIDGRELVKDIRSGMPHAELMEKYRMTPRQLERALDKVTEERFVRAKSIAEGIKSGLPDWELMRRHGLSRDGLRLAVDRLVRDELLTQAEVDEHCPWCSDQVSLDFRVATRHRPSVTATVIDRGCPAAVGVVRDISETGVGIAGISCQEGEVSKIAVIGDEFGEVAPFQFEAECRWHREATGDEEAASGYKITNISDEDLKALHEFIKQFASEE